MNSWPPNAGRRPIAKLGPPRKRKPKRKIVVRKLKRGGKKKKGPFRR